MPGFKLKVHVKFCLKNKRLTNQLFKCVMYQPMNELSFQFDNPGFVNMACPYAFSVCVCVSVSVCLYMCAYHV